MDLILKANAFFYAITGGILSFFLLHPEQPVIKWSLLLPAIMSIALTGAFAYGARLVTRKVTLIADITKNLPSVTVPDVNLLAVYLWCSAIIFLVVALSLIIMICTW
jgi:hypothetical protein